MASAVTAGTVTAHDRPELFQLSPQLLLLSMTLQILSHN